jgi:hypothetical protein
MMAAVTIRKLPDETHAVLKRRAKQQLGFGTELHMLWKQSGAPKLEVPPRTGVMRAFDFSGPEFGSDDL